MVAKDRQIVIWAMEAFPDEPALQEHTASFLKTLTENIPDVSILPVYVLSPDHLNWSGEFTGDWTTRYKPMAVEALRQQTESYSMTCLLPPKVLVQTAHSRRKTIRRLLGFAQRIDASALVLGTHARAGTERLFLGSFTESLLNEARLPVFVLNPHSRLAPEPLRHLIFATDFSEACREAYDQVLDFARSRQMTVHLFHKIPNPIDPVLQSGVYIFGGGWVSVETYYAKEKEERENDARQWVALAKSQGVEARFHIEDYGLRISDSIHQYANQFPGSLVAITSQSGRAASVLLGSVTRDVVRSADTPVWVIPAHGGHLTRSETSQMRPTPFTQLARH